MNRTALFYHPSFLEHQTGFGHPERPDRLSYLVEYLQGRVLYPKLTQVEPTPARLDWIRLVHPGDYIDHIQKACKSAPQYLDSDTLVSQRSFDVAVLAAGAVIDACTQTFEGRFTNAFCAVRPPGHHAEPAKAMGFCLFNNVAIAARFLQREFAVKKVCIVDWDVHHGNGTQAAFYDDPSVFYVSVHQHPLYPGTGFMSETGSGRGSGTTLNLPCPPHSTNQDYIGLFQNRVLPSIREFEPEFLIVSAGFDAHQDDPLAHIELTSEGFEAMTRLLVDFARDFCSGRVVSVLEGGYNLEALAESVEAHLSILVDGNTK